MPFWRLHYHLVWAVYRRMPLLTEPLKNKSMERFSQSKGAWRGRSRAWKHGRPFAHRRFDPTENRRRGLCQAFKGASAHYVNEQHSDEHFGWQDGYSALTFGDRSMSDIVAYVLNQKEHHQQNTVRVPFEQMTDEDDSVKILGE